MKKLKAIKFRAKVKGNGIVNYDGDQKQLVLNHKFDTLIIPKKKDNSYVDSVNFAKKALYKNVETDEVDYRIKISSDCMRKAIFSEDEHINPAIVNSDSLFSVFTLSPVGLLRGYFNTDRNAAETGFSYSRSSPVTVTAAIQVPDEDGNLAKSYIEACNSSGTRTDNSFFNRENVGDICYEFEGRIDIKKLQFISADPVFDRIGIKSDWVTSGLAQSRIKAHYGEDADFKCGIFSSSVKNIGKAYCEHGILLGHNVQEKLIRYFFEHLINARIDRARAYAEVTDVEVAPVYDILEESEWVSVDNASFLNDEYYTFYEECSDDELCERTKMIEKHKEQENLRRDEKQAEREEKKARAAKKAAEANQ